jgi:hypothetical protein
LCSDLHGKLRDLELKLLDAEAENSNLRQKLQESENKLLDARIERNEAVARLKEEVLGKTRSLDEKLDELKEVSRFHASCTLVDLSLLTSAIKVVGPLSRGWKTRTTNNNLGQAHCLALQAVTLDL